AEARAVLIGDVGRWRLRSRVARGNRPRREDQDVELRLQVALVERRRIHDLERELVAFEQPPYPAALNRAAVAVPQADAHGPQWPAARRRLRDGGERQPEVGGS